MLRFVRSSHHYRHGARFCRMIAEIAQLTRARNLPGYSRDGFDEGRMVSGFGSVLSWRSATPVEVNESISPGLPYALHDGMRRFYASIAAGYSHLSMVVVETIKAFLDAEEVEANAWRRANCS